MPTASAGLLIFRRRPAGLEVLLVHPGGPYWQNKDAGAWSIPKGECGDGEAPQQAARREVAEELGAEVDGPLHALSSVRQRGGKVVYAWAVEGTFDPAALRSNTFEMEWPPRSGRRQQFAEIDRAEWFALEGAREKINPAQVAFIDQLHDLFAR